MSAIGTRIGEGQVALCTGTTEKPGNQVLVPLIQLKYEEKQV